MGLNLVHLLKQKFKNTEDDKTGVVFNIQKFSLHDGPGIRTTVFLKGCPLSCLWCANPESMSPDPEIITNFDTLCRHCNACLDSCPQNAISVNQEDFNADQKMVRKIDRKRCDNCLVCADSCPTGAIRVTGKKRTAQAVLETVFQDQPFYKNSGGGLTLSGGEPLFQPEFSLALLKGAKRRGIHTVMDTSGYASQQIWSSLLPFLDLVLYDLKHYNGILHKKYTGVSNQIILENLKWLHNKIPVWLRIPIIPGYNSDRKNIEQIIEIAFQSKVEKVYFLPYHEWGKGKYHGLGKPFLLKNIQPLISKDFEQIANQCRDLNYWNFEIGTQ